MGTSTDECHGANQVHQSSKLHSVDTCAEQPSRSVFCLSRGVGCNCFLRVIPTLALDSGEEKGGKERTNAQDWDSEGVRRALLCSLAMSR